MSVRDAEEWYRRGQGAVAAGRVKEGIESLRRAVVRDRTNTTYILALGRALALDGNTEAAQQVLLALRESSPGDADVNLDLARLAARRQDLTEAVRCYHNALYAPWAPERSDARREVRFELIQFLLAHQQSSRALAELLALTADLPDQSGMHIRVGRLFADAGDHDHALQQFQAALRFDSSAPDALTGAGRNAFELGKYALARSYLRQAPPQSDETVELLQIVDLVLTRDPLQARLGAPERRRRLLSDLSSASDRLMACLDANTQGGAAADASALRDEAADFEDRLDRGGALDHDNIEAGLDLVHRIARHASTACGRQTPLDRALLLIAQPHGSDGR